MADAPRSYLVAIEKGGTLRIKRRHLRRTEESFQFSQRDVPEDIPATGSACYKRMTTKDVEKAVTPLLLKMLPVLLLNQDLSSSSPALSRRSSSR